MPAGSGLIVPPLSWSVREPRGQESSQESFVGSDERERERDACQGGRCEGHSSARGREKREILARIDRRMSDMLSFRLDLGR